MKWVRHDTDANQDAKLQNVLLDYGLEGYGLYWYCIELIAGKIDETNITFELEHDARIIARNTGSTPQKVEEMMKYFVKLGLFECSDNTITCLKLAKRLNKSMTSNPQMREIIENFKNHDSIMTESRSIMKEETRLDKNKDTKPLSKPKADSMDYKAIQESFNEKLTKAAKIVKMTDKRKRLVKKFFDDFDLNMERWQNYLEFINESPDCEWMFERRDRGNGQQWQPKGFEFIVSESCYLKVREQYS